MPDLHFQVDRIAPTPRALTPQLGILVSITNSTPEPVHSILLRCQLQIEAARRRYNSREQELLRDLFGEPGRWGETLHPLIWNNATLAVPGFSGATEVEVPAPCTIDYNLAVTKYLGALEDGDAPLSILFSGTVFYSSAFGTLQVQQIPWDREASFRVSGELWRHLMDSYYPGTAWVSLQRETFNRLYRYKVDQSIASVEEAIESLLPQAQRAVR